MGLNPAQGLVPPGQSTPMRLCYARDRFASSAAASGMVTALAASYAAQDAARAMPVRRSGACGAAVLLMIGLVVCM
jgi:hypothetical protein